MNEDLFSGGVGELARRLRCRELSAVEAVEGALERIGRLDPVINAFAVMLEDSARSQARESDARLSRGEGLPLDGVPIPIKDNVALAGVPTTFGSRMAPRVPAGADSELVARLRRAGAVFVGKTTLPEFGALAVTESDRLGVTRNPFDLERTPGGSSGGAAAAVASGMVPAAHGNDGAGSLRIPAACCGLFAVKPTRGRISLGPVLADSPASLLCEGFLTRTAADSALLLDLVAGPAVGDPYAAPALERPLCEEIGREPGRLRIGWTTRPPMDVPVEPAMAGAVVDVAGRCRELGHDVEEFDPGWQDPEIQASFLDLWAVSVGCAIESLEAAGASPDRAEPHNRRLLETARRIPASRHAAGMLRVQAWIRRLAVAWDSHDVVLTPVLAEPPLPIGELFPAGHDDLFPIARQALFAPFCAICNLTGQPAAQLPWGRMERLPVGVQLIGRFGCEAVLLRLAVQLERHSPTVFRPPSVEERAEA